MWLYLHWLLEFDHMLETFMPFAVYFIKQIWSLQETFQEYYSNFLQATIFLLSNRQQQSSKQICK